MRNPLEPEGAEVVGPNVSQKDLIDESNRRAAKCGYCSRSGEPLGCTKIQATVPCGKQKLSVWPRDKDGNLIGD